MEFAISQPKMVWLPRNEKQTYRLNCRAQMWPAGLTLAWPWPWIFKVKYGICYISSKNGPIVTERRTNISIELQGLKCDHQVWPWPWPWPWVFKVIYVISYISARHGPIATKRKANISTELQALNVTNGFDLDHNLDLWNLKVKRDLWPLTTHMTLTMDFHGQILK